MIYISKADKKTELEILYDGRRANRIPAFRVEAEGRKAKRNQPYYNQYHAVNSNRVTFYKKLKIGEILDLIWT